MHEMATLFNPIRSFDSLNIVVMLFDSGKIIFSFRIIEQLIEGIFLVSINMSINF